MPPIVLTTLKWLLLVLIYLFIARAIRVIYLDLVGPRVPRARTQQRRGRSGRKPRSISVTEPEQPARSFPLSGEDVVLGRSDSCTICLKHDTYVSQLHARIFARDGTWFVEDLGSTNGTYLNRMKVTAPAPLAIGDEVRVGKTRVEVRR